MATKSPKTREEEPDRFLKIMQYQSWSFLVVLIIDVIYILIKGLASGNGLFGGVGFYSLAFLLISVIGTGLGFGLVYQIQATPTRKKNLFTSYYVSIALVGIITVFVLAAYQW